MGTGITIENPYTSPWKVCGEVYASGSHTIATMAPMTIPTLNPPRPRSQSVTSLFSEMS